MNGVVFKAPPSTLKPDERMSPSLTKPALSAVMELITPLSRSALVEEYHTVRANMDRDAAAARAHLYESGRQYITERIVGFIATLYLNISEYKRAKDHRFNNWQEIVEDIKDIVITILAGSRDARLIGEGIAAQFDGLTTYQMMDHSLVHYHIANMDKLLNLLTERHAMMILSLRMPFTLPFLLSRKDSKDRSVEYLPDCI